MRQTFRDTVRQRLRSPDFPMTVRSAPGYSYAPLRRRGSSVIANPWLRGLFKAMGPLLVILPRRSAETQRADAMRSVVHV